jgi:hypothetical protein
MNAPFGDPSWAIWACSPDNTPFGHTKNRRTLPRFDQWFELHDPIEDPTRPFGYLKTVSEMPFVWMRDKRAMASGLFKGARPYPEKEIKGTFETQIIKVPSGTYRPVQGPDGKGQMREIMEQRTVEVPNMDGVFSPHMFTSSLAYMLAKAIMDCEQQGIPQIGVWGVLQQSDNEYAYQRPGIQYFLGEAIKRGIRVVANRESCLFDMPAWKW